MSNKTHYILLATLVTGVGCVGYAANRLDGLLTMVGITLIFYILGRMTRNK